MDTLIQQLTIVLTLVTMVGQPVTELKSNTVALRLSTPVIITLIKVRHCLTDFPFNKVYTTIFTVPAQTHSLYNYTMVHSTSERFTYHCTSTMT